MKVQNFDQVNEGSKYYINQPEIMQIWNDMQE